MKIFISHSTNQQDQEIVKRCISVLESVQVKALSSRERFQSSSLTDKIRQDISNCDCVLLILTKSGSDSAWVEQEIGIAIEQEKPLIPMLEEGVEPPGAIAEREYIKFDRFDFHSSLQSVVQFIEQIRQNKTWRLITGAGLTILAGAVLAAVGWVLKKNDSSQG